MSDRLQDFRRFRERMNERIPEAGNIVRGSIVIPHLRRAMDSPNRLVREGGKAAEDRDRVGSAAAKAGPESGS